MAETPEVFLRNLPRVQISSLPPDAECIICLEKFNTSTDNSAEYPVRLPCSHIVGSSCIRTWLSPSRSLKTSCPYCRRTLCRPPRVLSQAEAEGWEIDVQVWHDRALEDRLQDLRLHEVGPNHPRRTVRSRERALYQRCSLRPELREGVWTAEDEEKLFLELWCYRHAFRRAPMHVRARVRPRPRTRVDEHFARAAEDAELWDLLQLEGYVYDLGRGTGVAAREGREAGWYLD